MASPKEETNERDVVLDSDGTRLVVESREGYLCRVTMDVLFRMSPDDLLDVFCNPHNDVLFRDVASIPHRALMLDFGDGDTVVEVEQMSEVRILWLRKCFSILMHARCDRPNGLFEFQLAKRGIMRAFHGVWQVRAHYPSQAQVSDWLSRNGLPTDAASRDSTWSLVSLQHEVMPAGIPDFAARTPGIRQVFPTALRACTRRAALAGGGLAMTVNSRVQTIAAHGLITLCFGHVADLCSDCP